MKKYLTLLFAALLAGCAAAPDTAQNALTVTGCYPLSYAREFTVDECAGGYNLLTIDGSRYLTVPAGAAVPEGQIGRAHV